MVRKSSILANAGRGGATMFFSEEYVERKWPRQVANRYGNKYRSWVVGVKAKLALSFEKPSKTQQKNLTLCRVKRKHAYG